MVIDPKSEMFATVSPEKWPFARINCLAKNFSRRRSKFVVNHTRLQDLQEYLLV